MKAAICLAVLTTLAYVQAKPDINRFNPPAVPDSVTVSGYIDVPARIPVRVKLPASQRVQPGQRIYCAPYYSIASNQLDNLYVPSPNGTFPVIITKR